MNTDYSGDTYKIQKRRSETDKTYCSSRASEYGKQIVNPPITHEEYTKLEKKIRKYEKENNNI